MKSIINRLKIMSPEVFKDTPVLFAYLYGSYATGLLHPFSDLDIGIFVGGVELESCLRLELKLSLEIDAKLEHQVQSDVRVINHLPLLLKGEIITEGKLIYCIDDEVRIIFESNTRKLYFDLLPLVATYNSVYIQSIISRSGDDIAR